MSTASHQQHYALAAQRHHEDAVYLHDDGRIANADYHYGFAVECALKSLLLRYLQASMQPTKPGARPSNKPWLQGPNGKPKTFGHLPHIWSDVAMLLHGRSGNVLSGVLNGSTPFHDWTVDDRYLDGASAAPEVVSRHRAAAGHILLLHQQALITGVLQ